METGSLLGACGFKLHGIFIFFYGVFVCHVSSKESIMFISFHNIIWRYVDVTTALLQNQIIVIVYSIFLICLKSGVMSFELGILSTTKVNVFWKKHEKQILLISCLRTVAVEQHYHISPKNDFSQKSLFGLLNHLWYKPPKTIKWFFSWILWVRCRKGYVKHFWILAGVWKCRILLGPCK